MKLHYKINKYPNKRGLNVVLCDCKKNIQPYRETNYLTSFQLGFLSFHLLEHIFVFLLNFLLLALEMQIQVLEVQYH